MISEAVDKNWALMSTIKNRKLMSRTIIALFKKLVISLQYPKSATSLQNLRTVISFQN